MSEKIYGLIGYPVRHSLSPVIHNAAFKHTGIQADYRLFEIKPEELEDFLFNYDKIVKDSEGNSIYAGDIWGFNITIPHKVKAKQILEKAFPIDKGTQKHPGQIAAEMIGAINTVIRRPQVKFYNTDSLGFHISLKEDLNFNIKDKNVLLLGCGGVGRAIISSLTISDQSVRKIYIYEANKDIVNSASGDFSQWKHLGGKWEFVVYADLPAIIKKCDLLVNATPIGMDKNDRSIIERSVLHKDLYVYDVVYNRETRLIQDSKSLGIPAAGGLGMLFYQGVSAWELWTGQQAPVDVMRQALEAAAKK